MSSSICHEKCEQCGGFLIVESDSSTFEMFRYCNRCGYRFEYSLKRDENGKIICDENDNVCYETTESFGYGSVAFGQKDGPTVIYNLEQPFTDEIKEQFLKDIQAEGIATDKCYLMAWDNEKKELVAVYGKMPPDYQE